MVVNMNEQFKGKFEIPLFNEQPHTILDILQSDVSYYIHSVYAPPHVGFLGSGRPFGYFDTDGKIMSAEEYHDLLARIIEHVPITMTMPEYSVEAIRFYYNMGIKEFMISEWSDKANTLKQECDNIIFTRSIVGNACNMEVDEDFDNIVMPYKWMLDIDRVKSLKSDVGLIALPNHFCAIDCPYLDSHPQDTVNNPIKMTNEFLCPSGKSTFVPKEIIDMLLPFLNRIKLTDRMQQSGYFLNYLYYYTGSRELEERVLADKMAKETIELFESSSMANGNCKFECINCSLKCYKSY